MKIKMVVFLTFLALATACSPDKPQGVLSDGQKKVLKESKEVEGVLKDANDKQLKAIDDADSTK